MKKKISLILAVVMMVSLFAGIGTVNASGKSVAEIKQQIKDTATSAKSTFGNCNAYVGKQLEILKLHKGYSANGNQWYKGFPSKSSYGYISEKRSGGKCLETLYNEFKSSDGSIYNIIVSFPKNYPIDGDTTSYGHVLFIHAIIDKTVYFSESYATDSIAAGAVRTTKIDTFFTNNEYKVYGTPLGAIYLKPPCDHKEYDNKGYCKNKNCKEEFKLTSVTTIPNTPYYAIKDNVYYATRPYSAEYGNLKIAQKGWAVRVIASAKNAAGNTWYQFENQSGKYWVYSENVSTTNPVPHKEDYGDDGYCKQCKLEFEIKLNTVAKNTTFYITRDGAPIRKRPYDSGVVVNDKTKKGDKITNVIAVGKNSKGVEWYKLDNGNWIYSGNLSTTNPKTSTPTPTPKPTPKPTTTPTPTPTPKPTATPAPSTNTEGVTEGEYVLRSGSVYLSASKDSDGGNVNAVTSKDSAAQKWDVKKSGSAYRVTSKVGSAKRVLNVYTEGKSAAGTNVTLWSVTGHKTQLWLFEKKGDGYILHPSDNSGVALTVQNNNDVKLAANSGGTNQIWYLEAPSAAAPTATPTPTPTATPKPTATPEPSPSAAPEPTNTPAPTATPKPTQTPSDTQTGIFLQAELVGNEKQAIGIKFNWEPYANSLYYRIYRSERKGQEGISISDFPIKGGEYVDVNIKSYRDYYYTIRPVLAEASFDTKTGTLTSEKLGEASNEVSIKTSEIVTKIEQQRNFILMQIGKDTMLVNETTLEIDPGRSTTPAVVNGRTLVPIRAIIEAMGGTIDWDETTQKITLEANGHKVEMYLDKYTFNVDGIMNTLDVAPTAINGRTMLPVRFVAENIGCEIEWIGNTEQIVIVFYQ